MPRPTDKPPKAHKTKIRAWLQARGLSLGQAKQLAREDDDNATGQDIQSELITFCKALPKAKK